MWSKRTFLPVLLSFLVSTCAVPLLAQQQVTVSSPHTAVSDSFFEHTGTSWGAQGKNWFFQFGPRGNPNGAAPQFGGFSPSAGANFGFGSGGGGFMGNFSQGSRRSFTSVTPSVTMQNGGAGMIMDTSVSPFVMGYVPVVGGYPMLVAPSPVQPMVPPAAYVPPGPVSGHPGVLQALQNASRESPPSRPHKAPAHVPKRADDEFAVVGPGPAAPGSSAAAGAGGRLDASQQSSAGRPAMGVAEARRMHQAEATQQDGDARRFMERGRLAQIDGKPSLARTYYRMAVNRASPSLRQEVLKHLASLPAAADQAR